MTFRLEFLGFNSVIFIEMASNHKYEATAHGVMMWATSELEHVGRIASIKDEGIQYNYAMSTLFGMAHLKDALFELVEDPDYKHQKKDLLKTHDKVIRVMKHLCKEYDLDLKAIKAFNTKKVLSKLDYLKNETNGYNANNEGNNKNNNNNYNNNNTNNNNYNNNANNNSKSGGKRTRKNRK